MFGRAHDQPGLLVEPTHAINVKREAEVAQFRNLIWYLTFHFLRLQEIESL
jgi:hypothetical protein